MSEMNRVWLRGKNKKKKSLIIKMNLELGVVALLGCSPCSADVMRIERMTFYCAKRLFLSQGKISHQCKPGALLTFLSTTFHYSKKFPSKFIL